MADPVEYDALAIRGHIERCDREPRCQVRELPILSVLDVGKPEIFLPVLSLQHDDLPAVRQRVVGTANSIAELQRWKHEAKGSSLRRDGLDAQFAGLSIKNELPIGFDRVNIIVYSSMNRRRLIELLSAPLITRSSLNAAKQDRVVVAGAGIMGASMPIIWPAAAQTFPVLEKQQPGSFSKQPRSHYELNLAGIAGWRRLSLEL